MNKSHSKHFLDFPFISIEFTQKQSRTFGGKFETVCLKAFDSPTIRVSRFLCPELPLVRVFLKLDKITEIFYYFLIEHVAMVFLILNLRVLQFVYANLIHF